MLHTTRGIVLHHIKYSETSVIAKVYTETFGLQSYILKGVRRKGSKNKSALLQPLSLIELVAYHKEKGGVQNVKEIRLHKPFISIPYEITKSSIALFINEILYKVIREEGSNKELFEFLFNAIQLLDLEEHCVNFHLHFLTHLSKYLGFFPHNAGIQNPLYFDLEEGTFTNLHPLHQHFIEGEENKAFQTILGTNFDGINRLKFSHQMRKSLLNHLVLYYRLHLEGVNEINAHQVLETVLAE